MQRAHLGRMLTVAGASLAIAATVVLLVAVRAQRHAPQPPASAASPVAVTPTSPTGSPSSPRPGALTLPRSVPVHLSIPAIGVESDLGQIGLGTSGQIQTPPLARASHPYWLRVSPTPGQLGPAVIIGHVDSAAYGAGVFFRLGDMRQRDHIAVTRADGTAAVFQVQRVVEYPKTAFPTFAVYGNTDDAALRLITCGGTFNSAARSYQSNIVVYAALVGAHHA